jgi:hypothetical protein
MRGSKTQITTLRPRTGRSGLLACCADECRGARRRHRAGGGSRVSGPSAGCGLALLSCSTNSPITRSPCQREGIGLPLLLRQVTYDVYGHLFATMHEAGIAAVEAAFRKTRSRRRLNGPGNGRAAEPAESMTPGYGVAAVPKSPGELLFNSDHLITGAHRVEPTVDFPYLRPEDYGPRRSRAAKGIPAVSGRFPKALVFPEA